jgi:hypothetical protein
MGGFGAPQTRQISIVAPTNTSLVGGTCVSGALVVNLTNINVPTYLSARQTAGSVNVTLSMPSVIQPGSNPTSLLTVPLVYCAPAGAGGSTFIYTFTAYAIEPEILVESNTSTGPGSIQPATAPLTITTSYKANPTLTQLCVAIAAPGRPGSTYTGTVTGPGGTTQSFTGTLDSAGSALARINLTQTGTYGVTVFVGSLSATATQVVNATGGTCT